MNRMPSQHLPPVGSLGCMQPVWKHPFHVAILGAGALGRLLGVHLHEGFSIGGGAAVTLYTRTAAQCADIQCRGIEYVDLQGRCRCVKVPVAWIQEDMPTHDAIIVAVKYPSLDEVATRIRNRITPLTVVILLQNGFRIRDNVCRWKPSRLVYLSAVMEGAIASGYCQVQHTGSGVTSLGPIGAMSTYREHIVPPVLEILLERLPKFRYAPKILRLLWEKWVLSSIILPLTACNGISNGQIVDPPYRFEAIALLKEALMVGERLGWHWEWTDAWLALTRLCRRTYRNHSSMLQDLLQGRSTEVGVISGAMVELARTVGVEVPHQERFWRRICLREAVVCGKLQQEVWWNSSGGKWDVSEGDMDRGQFYGNSRKPGGKIPHG
ncbi:ketopantoate reductase family protein [Pasteuria penetrans]|uniref:ketopantoate reductase family protein n=1 Tax=Pasteuria penetrans TaxID=86005 RepID=UPI000FA1505F|nr:2-dehydropantoate 2-reductase [Pasteuria penetrans]